MEGVDAGIIAQLIVILIPILVWVGLSFAVGEYALRIKGRATGNWAIAAIFITPLLAFLIVALLPAIPGGKGSPFRKCPKCAETIRADAVICRYCRTEFEAAKDKTP